MPRGEKYSTEEEIIICAFGFQRIIEQQVIADIISRERDSQGSEGHIDVGCIRSKLYQLRKQRKTQGEVLNVGYVRGLQSSAGVDNDHLRSLLPEGDRSKLGQYPGVRYWGNG